MNKKFKTVEEYIGSFPEGVRGLLGKIRGVIKKSAPKARERMSYGMPFYEYGGAGINGRLIYFSGSKDHVSVYIPPSIGVNTKALAKYQKTESAFHFPLDRPFPYALFGRTVKVLVKNRNKKK